MFDAPYHDLLSQHGFERIGEIHYRLEFSVWWNAQQHVQVLLMPVGDAVLVKGDRTYYMKSTSERETWARDIGPLHDYLESHFREIRVSLAHFRDVPEHLARREALTEISAGSPQTPTPTIERIQEIQSRHVAVEQQAGSLQRLLSLSSRSGDLLSRHIHRQTAADKSRVRAVQEELRREQERFRLLNHLQREYQRKGSAAVFTISISSNLQIVKELDDFQQALRSVVAELLDYDRFQVQQKLNGGHLKIQVAESHEPAINWIEQWLGGALSPEQLARIAPSESEASAVLRAHSEHTMVTPDDAITVDGAVRHAPKHIAAHAVAAVLSRLDTTASTAEADPLDRVAPETMPLMIGRRVDKQGHLQGPALLPLLSAGHTIVSGTTGSGKSFFARVFVEEACKYKDLSILILDPRNQFSGLLVAEDRPSVIEKYESFGFRPENARRFDFNYLAPRCDFTPALPDHLEDLSAGRNVVSFRFTDDAERCARAAEILNSAFETCSKSECDHPRLLIAIDEAQLLTRRRVCKEAASAASRSENALDKIAREGRKYGVVLLLITQTFKSFSHELASLRQLATTKVFLRNSDLELEYAADILPDAKELVHLPCATALIHNANWGVHRIEIRPTFSKVYELSKTEIQRALPAVGTRQRTLTTDAEALLKVIEEQIEESGRAINIGQLAVKAGLNSRRKLHALVAELEAAREIRTHHAPERGKPRLITPLRSIMQKAEDNRH